MTRRPCATQGRFSSTLPLSLRPEKGSLRRTLTGQSVVLLLRLSPAIRASHARYLRRRLEWGKAGSRGPDAVSSGCCAGREDWAGAGAGESIEALCRGAQRRYGLRHKHGALGRTGRGRASESLRPVARGLRRSWWALCRSRVQSQ